MLNDQEPTFAQDDGRTCQMNVNIDKGSDSSDTIDASARRKAFHHMGTDDPTSPLHNPEGHPMPTITDSDENEKRMDELVFDKRKKRMARGYTNLIGEERVTAAMQKVFCFMEAKE